MSELGDELRALADKADRLAGMPSAAPKEENPVSVPSAPETAPEPKTAQPAMPWGEVRKGVQSARNELNNLKAEGANVNAVSLKLDEIESVMNTGQPSETKIQSLRDLMDPTIRTAQMIQEDQGHSIHRLFPILHGLSQLVGRNLEMTVGDMNQPGFGLDVD